MLDHYFFLTLIVVLSYSLLYNCSQHCLLQWLCAYFLFGLAKALVTSVKSDGEGKREEEITDALPPLT